MGFLTFVFVFLLVGLYLGALGTSISAAIAEEMMTGEYPPFFAVYITGVAAYLYWWLVVGYKSGLELYLDPKLREEYAKSVCSANEGAPQDD